MNKRKRSKKKKKNRNNANYIFKLIKHILPPNTDLSIKSKEQEWKEQEKTHKEN